MSSTGSGDVSASNGGDGMDEELLEVEDVDEVELRYFDKAIPSCSTESDFP